MTYLQFDFKIQSTSQTEELIALLSVSGFEGFEETESTLKAFIPEIEYDEYSFNLLITNLNVGFEKSIIQPVNWNEKWEQDFKPVLISDFVIIRTHFHKRVEGFKHEIIITPKMSFGTGHHATTLMMIENMRNINFKNKRVLDFGTGTGILAILAEKLGASGILAIDNDEWSVKNASENLIQNNTKLIKISKAEIIPIDLKFDIIMANINLNVVTDNLTAIKNASEDGADILLSGFLKNDEVQLLKLVEKMGFQHSSTSNNNGWVAMKFKKDD